MTMLLLKLIKKGVPMSIERIHKLLNSSRNQIKINTDLLKIMDTDEAILYSFLVPMFQKNLKQQDFRYFNDDLFVPYQTELIESMTGLSAFKQRNALNRLQKKNLLKVKLGQARTKYVSINENPCVLEKMLYGLSYSAFEEAFATCIKIIEKQANKNNSNRINIDSKYFLKCLKNGELFNNTELSELGWLSRVHEDEICDKICI